MVDPELVLVLPKKESGRELWVLEGRVEAVRSAWGQGIGVTAASCSITVGIGHGQRQEKWGSNV